MPQRRRYYKQPEYAVTAVQLILDTPGFNYHKWGAEQRCKQGDWLIDNNGEIYSVDAESFAKTYRQISPGRFIKTAPVWAEIAHADGSIKTKEGESHYRAGDYLVFNQEDGTDGYCIPAERFLALYQADES